MLNKYKQMDEIVDEMIKWSNDMIIDNSIIDNDHKLLIKLLSNIYDNLENYVSVDDFDKAFCELFDYISIHFSQEEIYMRKIQYININDHIKAHDRLIEMYGEKFTELKHLKKEVLEEFCDILKDHFLTFDKDLADHLKGKTNEAVSGRYSRPYH